jgi:hypothetical protein
MLSLTFSRNFLISNKSSGDISCYLAHINEVRIKLLVEDQCVIVVNALVFLQSFPNFSLRQTHIEEVIHGV